MRERHGSRYAGIRCTVVSRFAAVSDPSASQPNCALVLDSRTSWLPLRKLFPRSALSTII